MITNKEYKALKKMCNDYEKEQRLKTIKERLDFIDFLNIYKYNVKSKNKIELFILNNQIGTFTLNEIENEYLVMYNDLKEFYNELELFLNQNKFIYGYEDDNLYLHILKTIKPYLDFLEEEDRLRAEQIDDDYKDLPIDPT